jgi:hypothetical protein
MGFSLVTGLYSAFPVNAIPMLHSWEESNKMYHVLYILHVKVPDKCAPGTVYVAFGVIIIINF